MQPLPEPKGVRAGPHHPFGAESHPRAGPQPLLSFSALSFTICCSSDAASCVCVGFAKFLSSALSAENTLSPLPFVPLVTQPRGLRRGLCRGLPALAVGPVPSAFFSGGLCLLACKITPRSPSLGPFLASDQVLTQKFFSGKRHIATALSRSAQYHSLAPMPRPRTFSGSDDTHREK